MGNYKFFILNMKMDVLFPNAGANFIGQLVKNLLKNLFKVHFSVHHLFRQALSVCLLLLIK